MGRMNTPQEHLNTVNWARSLKSIQKTISDHTPTGLKNTFHFELKNYFALAALSRNSTADRGLKEEALRLVFRTRTLVENSIRNSLRTKFEPKEIFRLALRGSFFGTSKKQGVSLRMPLTSCNPTRVCAGACYAHDVLDAAPFAIIRGVLNGELAKTFERGDYTLQNTILTELKPHTRKAISCAVLEVEKLKPTNWRRSPYIRFSHVGEVTAFPKFANSIAKQVIQLSNKKVTCVVYTRHQFAKHLDQRLWTINFTTDSDSTNRIAWKPNGARHVFSAFDGVLDPEAEVNFLEHHRWHHSSPSGIGSICPATAPETKERTCDAVRCDRCFVLPGSVPENY